VETFVVQIWPPADTDEADGGDLRGFVEHIGSGRREAFRGASHLVAFFEVHRELQRKEVGLEEPP
jgi:hypothetical protein